MAEKEPIKCKELTWGQAKELKKSIVEQVTKRQRMQNEREAATEPTVKDEKSIAILMAQPEYFEIVLRMVYDKKQPDIDKMPRKEVIAHIDAFLATNADQSPEAQEAEGKKVNALLSLMANV